MRKSLLFAALMAILSVLPCAAETVAGLPLHVQILAPGAVRVWVGDHVSATAVSAIATRKGIVVIDTTNLPRLDEASVEKKALTIPFEYRGLTEQEAISFGKKNQQDAITGQGGQGSANCVRRAPWYASRCRAPTEREGWTSQETAG